MNVPRVNREEALNKAHAELNKISSQLGAKAPFRDAEVEAALAVLNGAAKVLEEGSFDTKSVKHHVSLLELADRIRNSPNFSIALGTYQTEFANLLQRMEVIIRKNNGTAPVKKVDLDRTRT